MKLKTHLHIADVVHQRFDEDLNRFFYRLGSVLPDILPNMRFRPHNVRSYDYLQKKIEKLCGRHNKIKFTMSVRLGIVSHFLSDLSCKPHMAGYEGSLIDHRKYEVNLSLLHGTYHEDLMESVLKCSAIVARIIDKKFMAIDAA